MLIFSISSKKNIIQIWYQSPWNSFGIKAFLYCGKSKVLVPWPTSEMKKDHLLEWSFYVC